MFSKDRAVITFHQCQSATVHCFGIRKSWPVSLALSLEILLIYLKSFEIPSFCYILPFLPSPYWLNADFNVYLHTIWRQTCYIIFVTCCYFEEDYCKGKAEIWKWNRTPCIWPYSCLLSTDLVNIIIVYYFKIFHMVHKKIILLS